MKHVTMMLFAAVVLLAGCRSWELERRQKIADEAAERQARWDRTRTPDLTSDEEQELRVRTEVRQWEWERKIAEDELERIRRGEADPR